MSIKYLIFTKNNKIEGISKSIIEKLELSINEIPKFSSSFFNNSTFFIYKNYKIIKNEIEIIEFGNYKIYELLLKEEIIDIDFFKDSKISSNVPTNNKLTKEIENNLKKAEKELFISNKIIKRMFNELLEELENSKVNLYKNLEKEDYEEFHNIIHKLKGISFNLRIKSLSNILKYIDNIKKNRKEKVKYSLNKLYKLLERIKNV